jgi:DNA-binding IclR family transcriptional regulator
LKRKIVELLEQAPEGLTSKYLAAALQLPRTTVRKQLVDMKAEGQIRGTGEYRRYAAVVVLAEQLTLELAA